MGLNAGQPTSFFFSWCVCSDVELDKRGVRDEVDPPEKLGSDINAGQQPLRRGDPPGSG